MERGGNLEESEEMIVVTDGNHAESEHDASRRPDIEAELPPEEICERAEDESSQDEPDHGESIEVSNHHGLQCCSITFCIIIITQTIIYQSMFKDKKVASLSSA